MSNSSNQPTIGFIGAGNMASALAGGMIANGSPADKIILSDISDQQLAKLENKLKVCTTNDNENLIRQSDILVLAVKPQVLQRVVAPLQKTLQESRPLIISIAAGITVDSINQWSGEGLAIIRCMPNTPALVKLGASGLYANEQVSQEQKSQAQSILEAVGLVEWLESESQIDAVTALSGSGPAYYFLMIEAMIKAGVELGLSESTAKTLTIQTALGAATMAQLSDVDVDELRRRVTSPNGTTDAALKCFGEHKYLNIVKQAMNAANTRSIELAKE